MHTQCYRHHLHHVLAVALFCALSLTLLLIQPAAAASCTVTSTASSGAGTLRQCLLTAANGDTITFDTTIFPPAAPATIALTETLPAITVGGITIDAANAGVKVDGAGIVAPNADGIVLASNNNAIYGLHLHQFSGRGIYFEAGANDNIIGGSLAGQRNIVDKSGNSAIVVQGSGNQVAGNWIGTEDGATLPGAAGNTGTGIEMIGAQMSTVGGVLPGQGNVIVGSTMAAVVIYGATATTNTVAGNYIGIDAAGLGVLGNGGNGVLIGGGATGNVVGGATNGARNYITGNAGDGVVIQDSGTAFNVVSGNVIGLDIDGTRDIFVQAIVLAPDYATSAALWVGTQRDGVWKSVDGGAHWAAANHGLTQLNVLALAVAPTGELFAGTTNGVFKSSDGGANWVSVSPEDNFTTVALAVSPNNVSNLTVVAATWDYLQVSTDGGATWQRSDLGVPHGSLQTLALAPNYATAPVLFVGTDSAQIFKSVNGGAAWTELGAPWTGYQAVTALGVAPSYAITPTIFAGISWGGPNCTTVYRSNDGGANWQELANQPDW